MSISLQKAGSPKKAAIAIVFVLPQREIDAESFA